MNKMAAPPMEGMTVLVVDDEPKLLRALKSLLSDREFEFAAAASGEEALEYLGAHTPDAIVLDLSLPGISGFEVCRTVRQWSDVPILILSVHDTDADKIAALELGADDYLTKPFSSGELLARIRALLRRSKATEGQAPTIVKAGALTIDLELREVTLNGEQVKLTRTQFDILETLAATPDRVVTTRTIFEKVWGRPDEQDTRSLRVHINHLRGKLEDDPSNPRRIVTEPGIGYRLATLK